MEVAINDITKQKQDKLIGKYKNVSDLYQRSDKKSRNLLTMLAHSKLGTHKQRKDQIQFLQTIVNEYMADAVDSERPGAQEQAMRKINTALFMLEDNMALRKSFTKSRLQSVIDGLRGDLGITSNRQTTKDDIDEIKGLITEQYSKGFKTQMQEFTESKMQKPLAASPKKL